MTSLASGIDAKSNDDSNPVNSMKCYANWFVALLLFAAVASMCFAQFRGGWGGRRWRGDDSGVTSTEGGVPVDTETVRTAREIASHSTRSEEHTSELQSRLH